MVKPRKKGTPPCVVAVPANVRYRVDESPKRKHHWDRDEPGFLDVAGVMVGKCPASMSVSAAELLLGGGVGFNPANWKSTWPERIYVVRDGWVYRRTQAERPRPRGAGRARVREAG